ncbi:MAG: ATP-binding protein, partial [Bacteroidota bacterium]
MHALTLDKNNVLWCGTWSQGLAYQNDKDSFQKLESLGDFKVNVFLETNNRLYIGTREGLFSLKDSNPNTRLLKHPVDLPDVTSLEIYDGNLWIGSALEGIAILPLDDSLNNEKVLYLTKKNSKGLKSNRISTIKRDGKEGLWIGTYNGLYRYQKGIDVFERHDRQIGHFPSVIILSVFLENDDRLWVGVPGGLLELDLSSKIPSKLNTYTKENGLFNDYVTAVTGDLYGNVWMSTAGGISKLNKEKRLITNYGIDDGISSISFNINSYFSNGKTVFFGSNNGIIEFNPNFVNENTLPPNLVFTLLKLDNKSVQVNEMVNGNEVLNSNFSYTEHINLTHKDKIISFTVSSTDFLSRDEINYYYKLEGLHDEWINNYNNPEISLSGLSRGNYKLLVKASRDNINFGNVLPLTIKMQASPWNSWYAYLLYSFVLIIVVAVIVFTLNRQTKLKSSLEIARIATEKEHDLTEAKLSFFTNISHEFKTPLTLIMGPLSQLLSDNTMGTLAKQKITNIHSNANRLLHLINQLLDFRKAENGMLNLHAADGNFARFAREIYLSFEGLAKSKEISFVFKTNSDDIALTYDRDKMEIVLCNLLSNAFKHTKKNGEIVLDLIEGDDKLQINVFDNGKGIPKKYHERIFDRFYQIRETDSLNMVGSGIGLSFSKKIVEQHSGTISVSSKDGKGSVFTIILPKGQKQFRSEDLIANFKGNDRVSEDNTSKILPIQGQPVSIPKDLLETDHLETNEPEKERILVVDDNSEILSFLEELLIDSYTVITAENGTDALEIALKEIPDIILSDVMMPGLNGISLCDKIKTNVTTSHIPVVLLTARTATVFEVDGLKTGADDYIKKPFDPAIVTARLEAILKNRDKLRKHYLNKIRFEPTST